MNSRLRMQRLPLNFYRYILFNFYRKKYNIKKDKKSYFHFMFNESYFLSRKYLSEKVIIYISTAIEKCKKSGAIIGFIHYGSFFLSGSALIQQLGCKFTLIASLENQVGRNKSMWKSFHSRYNKFYTSKIILNTDYLNNYVKLLKSNYFIGVALDVHTKRKNRKIKKISFLDYHVYIDDYISLLSQKYNKPVIACNIFFDSKEQLHKIYLSEPIPPNPYQAEKTMSFIQNYIFCESQYFHNLKKIFSSPSHFK